MNDVIDVICTLLLHKYPSIDAVYEFTFFLRMCGKVIESKILRLVEEVKTSVNRG